MIDLSSLMIPPDMSVIEAMSVIDRAGKGIAFICEDKKLLATLSDGDIRRHILANGDLSAPVLQIGNSRFRHVKEGCSSAQIESQRKKWGLTCVPILNDNGLLTDVYFLNSSEEAPKRQLGVPVVVMAGGKGTRLYPYTKILPKPLIPVGDMTITEHILKSFMEYRCTDFTMIVNHKKNMIKAYFADNPYAGCQVSFLDEYIPLGTGGGLGLLRGKVRETFFMTNCDILIFEDYAKILDHHRAAGNMLTMVCTTKQFSIPYGTIEIDGNGNISSITEKPSYSFLANTGFYVIEPEFLDGMPGNTFSHITDLIQKCMNSGGKVGIYPVSEEQWSDMGQPEELEKMRERLGGIDKIL